MLTWRVEVPKGWDHMRCLSPTCRVQNNTHNVEDQFHSRPGQPRNYNVLFVLSLTYDLL